MKLILSLIVVCLCVASTTSQFVVNSTADTVTPTTLRFALLNVNGNNPSINVLIVGASEFAPATPYTVGAYTGVLTIQFNGASFNLTTQPTANIITFINSASLDGFTLFGSAVGTLNAFVFTGGNAVFTDFVISGIANSAISVNNPASNLTVDGGTITGITSGIVVSAAASVTINNTVIGQVGDLTSSGVVILSSPSVVVDRSQFQANRNGAIVFSGSASSVSITNSLFGEAFGGSPNAITFQAAANGPIAIANNNFTNNGNGTVEFRGNANGVTLQNNIFLTNGIPVRFLGPATAITLNANAFTNNAIGVGTGAPAAVFFGGPTVNSLNVNGGSVITTDLNTDAFVFGATTSSTGVTFTLDNILGTPITISGCRNGFFVPGGTHTTWDLNNLVLSSLSGNGITFGASASISGFTLTGSSFGLDVFGNDAPIQLAGVTFAGINNGITISTNNFANTLNPVLFTSPVGGGSVFSGNTISDGGSPVDPAIVFSFTTITGGLITNNNINTAGAVAIQIATIASTSITQNTIINGNTGILITTDATVATSTIFGNTITGNTVAGITATAPSGFLTIGAPGANANSISGNAKGIVIPAGTVQIQGNSIFNNIGAAPTGIDVGTPGAGTGQAGTVPTDFQNAPLITTASLLPATNITISGSITTVPSSTYTFDTYCTTSATPGEGQTYLATSTVATGAASPSPFSFTIVSGACAVGDSITVTATSTVPGSIKTSEFSNPLVIVAGSVSPSISVSSNASLTPVASSLGVSPNASSPGASSPGASSPGASSPGASSPGASSPGASSPGISPNASSPGASSPGASSPGASSPGASSPGASSPGASSPGASSPGASSPGASSPGASSPGASSPAASSPGRSPSTTPGLTCRDGTVDPNEDCDFGAQSVAFYRSRCCNRNSCEYRRSGTQCGNRPVNATPRCVSVPRCSIAGVCVPSKPKVGKRCAFKKVCDRNGRCVRKK